MSYINNDVILTNSGKGYINSACYIVDYIQYCLFEIIPNHGKKMKGIENLQNITSKVLYLLKSDINELTELYDEGDLKQSEFQIKYNKLITLDIIYNYFIVGIISSLKKGFDKTETLIKREIMLDLKSFFNQYTIKIDYIFKTRPSKFNTILEEFKSIR